MTVAASSAEHRRAEASERAGSEALHPLVWAAWLVAGLITALLTSNPLYLALIALSALIVYSVRRQSRYRALDALLALGITTSLLTLPLNLLTGSAGTTRLFALPTLDFPGWLAGVTLGGPVTAESLLYAVTHAIAIMAILALVCSFNVSIDHFKLLKYTPAGLAQLGIIVTISLLLVPETLKRVATLREARIVRGYDPGLRSLPALLLPILADALERSVQRAESLDARGFGRLSTPPEPVEAVSAVAGLAVCACSAFAFYYYAEARAWAVAGFAIGLVGVAVLAWRQTRQAGATRVIEQKFSTLDVVVICASLGSAIVFGVCRALAVGGVSYLAFPTVTVPPFDPVVAAACLLLLAPALISPRGQR